MATAGYFKQLRLVGGHIALDFVNTEAGPPDDLPELDALAGYQDLLRWAVELKVVGEAQADLLADEAGKSAAQQAAALHEARRARSYLYELFGAVADQERPSASVLQYLGADEAVALHRAQLVAAGDGFRWDWSGCTDLRVPLWLVVHSAVSLLTTGPVRRVKKCGGCRFIFIDRSKNGSRRWCSMDGCGKVEKVHNYVSRRRALTRSARPNRQGMT